MDDANGSIEHYAIEIAAQGYTIIPNVLSPNEVIEARDILTALFEKESRIGPQRGWHTRQYLCCYMLPQKHEFFRKLPLNPRVLPLMRRVLGENCILSSLNGLTMLPRGQTQPLHLDQPDHVPHLVININALYTLDDFTKENGCTRIVPDS